jgi:hypothetical protein
MSINQYVYTFTNGSRFIVRDGHAQVWNGREYVSKSHARTQFKALTRSGLTYETRQSEISQSYWDARSERNPSDPIAKWDYMYGHR